MDSIFPNIQPRALQALMTPEELSTTLRTCTIPPFSAGQVSVYIRDAQHDVKLFENCIQRLRVRQAALQRDIARYSSLHSPVRRLPPEILRRIFAFSCKQDHLNLRPFRYPTFAFHLSRVCSRWREITLHAPELWANLSFDLDERVGVPVCLAISRSQQHPLSLQICRCDESLAAGDLFQCLLEIASRWRYVDLSDQVSEQIDQLAEIGDTPVLETLVCKARHVEEIFESISHAPRLRSIEYRMDDSGPTGLEGVLDTFPWDTLRRLDMGFDGKDTPVSAFNALCLGSGLQSLVYHGGVLDYSYSAESFFPVVSNITTLSFESGSEAGFYSLLQDFLCGVTLPSLATLDIRFNEHELNVLVRMKKNHRLVGDWPRDEFRRFMHRSGCTLTTLSLEGMPLTESDVISVLKLTPSVYTFTLSEFWASDPEHYTEEPPVTLKKTVTSTLLKYLEAPTFTPDAFSAQTPLLPKLRSLKMVVQSHFDADQVFVDMVKSRWNGGGEICSELRTVVLYVVNRKLVEGIYEPLKRLDEEGMMVTVFGDGIRVV